MLTLTAEVRRIVSAAMMELPQPYNAVHLRNTDLVVDFDDARSQIGMLDPEIPILVASDNAESLATISQVCPENKFFSIAKHYSADGTPLHFDTSLDPRKRNLEVLIDLLALASSESVVVPMIMRGIKRLSGFSRLAKELHDDSALLSRVLDADAVA